MIFYVNNSEVIFYVCKILAVLFGARKRVGYTSFWRSRQMLHLSIPLNSLASSLSLRTPDDPSAFSLRQDNLLVSRSKSSSSLFLPNLMQRIIARSELNQFCFILFIDMTTYSSTWYAWIKPHLGASIGLVRLKRN